MNYKSYTVSFHGKQYSKKPDGKEAAYITNKLKPTTLSYDFLAHHVGELGCTFAPAVFNGTRRTENFIGQQLFAIDIDGGADYHTINERADRYHLPVLFAYRSFSWTAAQERFRVVFAMDREIADAFRAQVIIKMLMCIFEECDTHCSDLARLFYGSNKGLLFLSPEPSEISFQDLVIAVNSYLFDKYDESHYTAKVRQFYSVIGLETKKEVPAIAINTTGTIGKRRTTKVDFAVLKERCQLFRDFIEGNEYYYYPTLFRIATNMVNMDKGKDMFLKIIDNPENAHCFAYHTRSWKPILNTIIDMNYQPMSCHGCPHEDSCPHYKNMILTVDAGKCGIRPLIKKEYVSIAEAEKSLAENFRSAVESEAEGIKLIIAQTGLGKTNTYLHYLKDTKHKFIIAAPTHKLIQELHEKALSIGVTNILCMPEMPELSQELQEEMTHLYNIGAGKISLQYLRAVYLQMKPDNIDYWKLHNYFSVLDKAETFDGHILMTHERFLYLSPKSRLLEDRKVIIDEDILGTAFATVSVDIADMKRALKMDCFDKDEKERMTEILNGGTYQRYHTRAGVYSMEDGIPDQLDEIQTNILDLLNAKVLVKSDDNIIFIKTKYFPTYNVIIMSATVNPDLYKWLMYVPVETYQCKQAQYMGKLHQYTNSSYSRKKLTTDEHHDALLQQIKGIINDSEVITFKCCETAFHTHYHYGAIEGLNVLEGQDIAVIGLPNADEKVYKLYGMMMGVDADKEAWKYRKIQYNGYEFYLNTFSNYRLQTIQLWMIESNLEQAVGRARLLRHDCTVTVFARFPIDQAEVV